MNKGIFVLTLLSLLLGSFMPLDAATFKKALPGYRYSFPRDHASHDQFKTEWWYFTGHLESDKGNHYGYELTFFRSGTDSQPSKRKSEWSLKNVYLAHFAITDINRKKFKYFQKLNRKGIGLADARSDIPYVFNEHWSMKFLDKETVVLSAKGGAYKLDLMLSPAKKLVIHGKDGVSQKASCKGCASHYYSYTRLKSKGVILIDGQKAEKVTGLSWMDHEFGSNQLTENQVGWDWFSIQLDDKREIMLYVMRRKDGSIDKHSSGTIVQSNGQSRHLTKNEFIIKNEDYWLSPKSKGKYPMGWTISIPGEKLNLKLSPVMKDQELATGKSTGVTYWEGAARVEAEMAGKPINGNAYVEMTGYSQQFRKRI